MMAGRRISQVLVTVAPLLFMVACGDDTEGTGGGGGAGGGTTASTSTSGPTTSVSSTTTVGSSTSSSSTGGDGGGGSDTGGGGSNSGGGGQNSGGGGSNSGGGGQNAGGGGSGGGETNVIDGEDCSAEPVELPIGQTTRFTGDTTGTADDLNTCFVDDPDYDGGELVLAFTLPEDGSVRIRLDSGAELVSNLVFRGTVCEDETEEFCASDEFFGDPKGIATHLEAGTYYVVIDTVGDAEGSFDLSINYGPPVCGDGILNPGEACDAGPGVPNDGCIDPGDAEECQLEPPPENFDICDGEAVTIVQGVNAFLASDGYSTIGFNHDYDGSCQLQPFGVDRVFAMTPEVSGTVTVRVGFDENNETPVCSIDPGAGCWDQLLYARSDCGDIGSELACADDTGPGGEEITFAVTQDEPFYVFVDGYTNDAASQGPFNLFVDLQ